MSYLRLFLIIPILTIALSGCFITDWWDTLRSSIERLPTEKLTIERGDKTIDLVVEIADDDHERQHGLMERTKVGSKEGMWFVFENEDIRRFWMWNMEIPIDILYVNEDLRVRGILENVQPCNATQSTRCPSYPSSEPVQYVLEAKSGFVEEHGIQLGDKIVLENSEDEDA